VPIPLPQPKGDHDRRANSEPHRAGKTATRRPSTATRGLPALLTSLCHAP
jgi:hypothetical protein